MRSELYIQLSGECQTAVFFIEIKNRLKVENYLDRKKRGGYTKIDRRSRVKLRLGNSPVYGKEEQ